MSAAPTLITSWYGMNFQHMPELSKPWAYPTMIVVMATVVGGIYAWLRKSRWLEEMISIGARGGPCLE